MSNTLKLRDIAEIQAGYSFRGSIPVSEQGNYRVIQIKDIGFDGRISNADLAKTNLDFIKPEYLARKDDILFTSRGTNRRAAVVDGTAENAIFVSQLYSLRLKSEKIIPEYLAWYLNQKPAQDFFEENASGSYIQNIRQDVLGELPVVVPEPETQKRIIDIYQLSLEEKELTEKILIKRRQIVEQALRSVIEQK
jgi:restriction endonuclease S subunit